MNLHTTLPLLFATGNERLESMASRFQDHAARSNPSSLLVVLGALAILAVAAWICYYAVQRWNERPVDSPRRLFREICQAHGLTRADRQLLMRMAEWWNVSEPVQLFFERERFRSPRMHEALDCENAARELEHRLFGADPSAIRR